MCSGEADPPHAVPDCRAMGFGAGAVQFYRGIMCCKKKKKLGGGSSEILLGDNVL